MLRRWVASGCAAALCIVTAYGAEPDAPAPPVDYKAGVEQKVRMLARDPTSILYEWGSAPRMGWTDMAFQPRAEGLIGCVMVKGKNGFGGYDINWKTIVYVVDPITGHVLNSFQTFDGKTPRVGKHISHDPGCPEL